MLDLRIILSRLRSSALRIEIWQRTEHREGEALAPYAEVVLWRSRFYALLPLFPVF